MRFFPSESAFYDLNNNLHPAWAKTWPHKYVVLEGSKKDNLGPNVCKCITKVPQK